MVELLRSNAQNGLFLGDEAFLLHVDGNLQRSSGGTLANAGLQHEELALLDGELDVHHVAEVLLEHDEDVLKFLTGLLETRDMLEFGNRRSVADAGDDVLALSVDEVVAIELVRTVGCITSESNARRGGVALVAEHHALNVDGSAEVVGNLVLLTVEGRTRVVPRTEHGFDCKAQLLDRILRERNDAVDDELGILFRIDALGENALERCNEFCEIICIKVGVLLYALCLLGGGDGLLELVTINAHDDVAEHLDETTIAIPCEARISGLLDKTVDGTVVQTKVENGVHHAGHRHRSTRAYGNKQRIVIVADAFPHALFEIDSIFCDLIQSTLWPGVVSVCIFHARLASDRESRRDRQADVRHLGEVCTFAADHELHVLVAFGNVVALRIMSELVHALDCFSHFALLLPKWCLW